MQSRGNFRMPIALIVEDEPEANRLLARLVQLRGFQPVSAFNGAEARAAIVATPPDVVFLDLMLPDASGFEICVEIKSRRATAAIPVVMNSARLATENRLQSHRHGANVFLPKPYFPDQIFQVLDQASVWKNQAAQQPDAQTIPLDVADEPAAYAAVSALWGLILHRTDWDEVEIARWFGDLHRCVQEILGWGRGQSASRLGTLSYELLDDHLRLKILDEAGWTGTVDPGAILTPPGRFAQATTLPGQPETVLHVRFDG